MTCERCGQEVCARGFNCVSRALERAESRLANMTHEAEQTAKRYAAYVSPEVHQAVLAELRYQLKQPDLTAYAVSSAEALRGLLDHYVALVNSGDAGNWNPEEEAVVIAARKALQMNRSESDAGRAPKGGTAVGRVEGAKTGPDMNPSLSSSDSPPVKGA